ncbi:hypothetical protein SprV_0802600100 [Sparganum proliferum]
MGTTSINGFVALPAAYQALRAQLSKQMSRSEPRLNMNPDISESMTDAHSVTPQPGSDEGAAVTTAVPSTNPADEKTDSRCGVNKIASLGRQLRSMKIEYFPSPSPPVLHSPCGQTLVTTKADPPPPFIRREDALGLPPPPSSLPP